MLAYRKNSTAKYFGNIAAGHVERYKSERLLKVK